MDTTQQAQVSGAQGSAQAVAPAPVQPAPQAQALTTPPAHIHTQQPSDQVPRAYLEDAKSQAIRRKEKLKALKSEHAKAQADLTATATERDQARAAAEAAAAKLKTLADRMAEQALINSIKAEGLSDEAAQYLIPSLRAHVEVDPESFEVKLKSEEVKKAAALFKPQTPQPQPASPMMGGRAAALHQQAAAARAPSALPDQPMTAKQRLAAQVNAHFANKK